VPPLPQDEESAFRCISNDPKHIDSIMKECRASAGLLNSVLISLELKGLVKQLPGKYYVRDEKG
jgi:DNA processing protein